MRGRRRYAAFLFDMDGTLLDSIPSAIRAWTEWSSRHGIDADALLRVMHGVRAVETITRFATPGMDVAAEYAALTRAEIADVDDVVAIDGAAAFLASLPADRWAIVTSAPRELARARLAAAGLDAPAVFITAEDVATGKPAPDCFLAAAQRLGVAPADCLIWEDAPAGVAAAQAAGADVMVVTATHANHASPLTTRQRAVRDYGELTVTVADDGWLELSVLAA
ncbi:MAG: HAD-IA family hydrolase [Sphingomonas adhaesiva]|uniref:HAD-IA family hydrolase n=1 Tax=Sphingomonas adhaesiva TaxID=28212 RepID=UPI002FFA0324